MDELENSISVKISKEAVMSINSPESLFTPVNGIIETKVYIAGMPNRTDNIIKPVSRSFRSIHFEQTHSRDMRTHYKLSMCVFRSTLDWTDVSGAGT